MASANTNLIRENWDDILRSAGSLKLGLVLATSIMMTLRIDDRPTKLAPAVAERGRIDKTIHSLIYIDDESKRRRILKRVFCSSANKSHVLDDAGWRGCRGPRLRSTVT